MKLSRRCVLTGAGATAATGITGCLGGSNGTGSGQTYTVGTVEQVGAPDEVYERPSNEFVADFVGTSNRLPAEAGDGALDFGHATVPVPDGHDGAVTVIARPEAFELGRGSFEATVTDRNYLGEHVQIVADLPGGESVTLRLDPADAPTVGEDITLGLDTERVHVIPTA